MNNVLNRATSYLRGEGSRPLLQNIFDYGTAAALGATGQQVMNMVTPGADPNPLISGALYAPLGVRGIRSARAMSNPQALASGVTTPFELNPSNPIERAALNASIAGSVGGGLASVYNTLTSGTDYDNNLVAAGVGSLAAIAPIAYSLIKKRKNIVSSSPKTNPKTRSSDPPGFGYTGEGYSDLFDELEDIKRKFYNNNE